ncbi:MAG: SpoIIIAH-like family protein [Lachnospiraceae bacterium]|nr:SpoIIIAH-like family protein [Lachnospiraceae bacterium]
MKKNQIIITVFAIMVAVIGYLNFSEDKKYDNTEKTDELAYDISEDELGEETMSDNVLVGEFEDLAGGPELTTDVETDIAENDINEDIGEAILVNSTIDVDYFYTAKLEREQVRAKNKEELMSIVDNDKTADEQKQMAINEIIDMADKTQKENDTEIMLEAKGFANSVVTISDSFVDVIIDASSLDEKQIALITDVVTRKTEVLPENVVITPVNSR